MNLELLIGIIFSMMPVMELRASIPLIVDYGMRNNVTVTPYLALAMALNILTILLIWFFLDFLHKEFMKITYYREVIKVFIEKRIRKKIKDLGYLKGLRLYFALFFLIGLPLPGTGIWTSAIVSWTIGLERKKAFITITLGAILAGIIVYLATMALFGIFY